MSQQCASVYVCVTPVIELQFWNGVERAFLQVRGQYNHHILTNFRSFTSERAANPFRLCVKWRAISEKFNFREYPRGRSKSALNAPIYF